MSIYITNAIRDDGFGAQYQTIIFTILYAELYNLKFVYRPFSKMAHNYDNDENFLEKKEQLINIQNNFPSIDSIDPKNLLNLNLKQIYNEVEQRLNLLTISDSFHKIKKLFYENKSPSSERNTLSVHIRRANKFDIGTYGYESDNYYLKAIEYVLKKNPEIEKIKIYSQGQTDQFENFKSNFVELHLNEPIEKTFSDLVFSNHFIMSKGSFSYTAGLLNQNSVYYLPFWHPPLNQWTTIK